MKIVTTLEAEIHDLLVRFGLVAASDAQATLNKVASDIQAAAPAIVTEGEVTVGQAVAAVQAGVVGAQGSHTVSQVEVMAAQVTEEAGQAMATVATSAINDAATNIAAATAPKA